VAELVEEFSFSEYAIDDSLSRLRWIPEIKQEKVYLSGVRAKRLGEAGSPLDLRTVFR
jgi:hypothetical protein